MLNGTFILLYTCEPDRSHHNKAEENVDSKTPGHLNVGLSFPLFVFLDCEPSLVPVFIWGGKIETEEEVEDLVQEIVSLGEHPGGEDLDKKSHEKLCPCQDEEDAESPFKSYSCIL